MQADVQHFVDECEALHAILTPLAPANYARPTGFKGWTIDRVLQHLHVWNRAATLSLADEARFKDWYARTLPHRAAGTLALFEHDEAGGLAGPALRDAWRIGFHETAGRFAGADPKQRVHWALVTMSARSSITARLMESWAHGQAVFDLLGINRQDTDRLHGIAVLGANTFEWTFRNRGLRAPGPMPALRLRAPSGALWAMGDDTALESIEGSATAFCQVVAQTRNVADTDLVVSGPTAQAWMAIAQCFAGPPEDPPKPGTRRIMA